MEYQKPIIVPATANTPRFVSALYERIQPLTAPAFRSIFASNHFHIIATVVRVLRYRPPRNLWENTAKASRRKCEFDQMREVPSDDLALATSHLAQSSSASRVAAGASGFFIWRVRVLHFEPIGRAAAPA